MAGREVERGKHGHRQDRKSHKGSVRRALHTVESLETQNAVVLEFLKDQGIATDEKLTAYFERAGSASSVKWRAARARMAYLLAPAPKKATVQKEQPAEKQPQGKGPEPKDAVSKDAEPKEDKASIDVSPNDAPLKDTETEGAAASEPEPKDAEKKPSETKKPGAMVSEMKSAAPNETKRKTEKVKSEEHGSGSVSGGDRIETHKADSQQDAGASKQDAKSKSATAGQGHQNDPARGPNGQDAPVQSRKAK
jgi:hypothetical protein